MFRTEVDSILKQFPTRAEMRTAIEALEENIKYYILSDLMSYDIYANAPEAV